MTFNNPDSGILFKTNRVKVKSWQLLEEGTQDLAGSVLDILTPNVTKALPDDWQNISTKNEAENWISARENDSSFYAIILRETKEIEGFLFLYEADPDSTERHLRLGYLLAESVWGIGLGSEFISGLVNWAQGEGNIRTLSGGVEENNIGSIKVLEKNGFTRSEEELPRGMLLFTRGF